MFLWDNLGPTHVDRLAALARAMPGGGPEVVAVELFARSDTYPWRPTPGGSFRRLTLVPPGTRPSHLRLAWRLLRVLLAERQADVYLCHYERGPVILAALALRLLGRRVFALFTSKFDDRPRWWPRELAKALALLPYHGALCGSPRAIDYLAFLGLPRARLRLGYNALSTGRVAALAGAPPAPGGLSFAARDFVAVARLVPKKNLAMAIDAYALWLRTTGGTRDLHLCGSGPLEESLRTQAARLGIAERVRFHGFLQADGVARLLARALCLLLPSTEEQFGNAVIEAQAMGVPVLVSRAAGAADRLVASGLGGFVIDPVDPRGCAALMALLSEDKALWAALCRGARAAGGAGGVARFVAGVAALSGLALAGDAAA